MLHYTFKVLACKRGETPPFLNSLDLAKQVWNPYLDLYNIHSRTEGLTMPLFFLFSYTCTTDWLHIGHMGRFLVAH
jgi:hypothetical protein